jgi:hypothetical protein
MPHVHEPYMSISTYSASTFPLISIHPLGACLSHVCPGNHNHEQINVLCAEDEDGGLYIEELEDELDGKFSNDDTTCNNDEEDCRCAQKTAFSEAPLEDRADTHQDPADNININAPSN